MIMQVLSFLGFNHTLISSVSRQKNILGHLVQLLIDLYYYQQKYIHLYIFINHIIAKYYTRLRLAYRNRLLLGFYIIIVVLIFWFFFFDRKFRFDSTKAKQFCGIYLINDSIFYQIVFYQKKCFYPLIIFLFTLLYGYKLVLHK